MNPLKREEENKKEDDEDVDDDDDKQNLKNAQTNVSNKQELPNRQNF